LVLGASFTSLEVRGMYTVGGKKPSIPVSSVLKATVSPISLYSRVLSFLVYIFSHLNHIP